MSENSLLSGNFDSNLNNSNLMQKDSNHFSNVTFDEMIYSTKNQENANQEQSNKNDNIKLKKVYLNNY